MIKKDSAVFFERMAEKYFSAVHTITIQKTWPVMKTLYIYIYIYIYLFQRIHSSLDKLNLKESGQNSRT